MIRHLSYIFLFFWATQQCLATPLTNPGTNPKGPTEQTLWKSVSADKARNLGLFELAESIYKQILATKHISEEEKNEARQNLISTYISQKKFWDAQQLLNEIKDNPSAGITLRRAIVAFYTQDLKNSESLIKEIDLSTLSESDLSWHYLLQGLIAQKKKHYDAAAPLLKKAKEAALNDYQRTVIESIIIRGEIFSGKASESLARSLQKKISRNKKLTDLNFYKEYAIVLEKIGRSDEALLLLENKLQSLHFDQVDELHTLQLLVALISGPGSKRAEEALKTVLLGVKDESTLGTALTLLAQAKLEKKDYAGLYDFLSQLIGSSKDQHPIIDQIYMLRAQTALLNDNLNVAEKDALFLLETFPGSKYKPEALYLLAFLNWSSTPPKYRNAASYLAQLLQEDLDTEKRICYLTMVGDCYYLNNDYENAASIYHGILDEYPNEPIWDDALLRLVLSLINNKDIDGAQLVFDTYNKLHSVKSEHYWEIEWRLISTLRDIGQLQTAYARIQKILSQLPSDDISAELHLQLLWLKAQLAFDTNDLSETQILTESILSLIATIEPHSLSKEKKEILTSNTQLLRAQTLYRLKQPQEAIALIEKLRRDFPNTESAILSYIIEARHHAEDNKTAPAQQQLIRLSDEYPENEHAQVALYEAALNAESRGLNKTYREALAILERLANTYPSSRLVYYARLKQADILRKLNDFDGAQLIYENLINQYPAHKEREKAELSRADCLLARGTKDFTHYKEASAIYERLFDISALPVDLRAEAAFKYSFAQTKLLNQPAAHEMYWLAISKLLLESNENAKLGPKGRYWISRSIFELADALSQQNQNKQAKALYGFITKYGLPGQAFANTKI